MSWIFTTIILIFLCVYIRKAQKADIKLEQKLNTFMLERRDDVKNKVSDATEGIVERALIKAMKAINEPKSKGYLVTTSSDTPKAYAVWRKVHASAEHYGSCHIGYGMAYILVKRFDSDNSEENLKNATELCSKLNDEL